jgi:hypothetical protein
LDGGNSQIIFSTYRKTKVYPLYKDLKGDDVIKNNLPLLQRTPWRHAKEAIPYLIDDSPQSLEHNLYIDPDFSQQKFGKVNRFNKNLTVKHFRDPKYTIVYFQDPKYSIKNNYLPLDIVKYLVETEEDMETFMGNRNLDDEYVNKICDLIKSSKSRICGKHKFYSNPRVSWEKVTGLISFPECNPHVPLEYIMEHLYNIKWSYIAANDFEN